jgi:Pyruvate/2-oxoacid:ferredoxin oxidoreductase delta subunit
MPRKTDLYRPDPELLSHFPPISGNAVNGLGEAEKRRPSRFFWHPADQQTHGDLQRYIMGNFERSRDGGTDWGDVGDRGPALDPVAQERQSGTAESWTTAVKDYALTHEADLVGVTFMDPLWVYEGYDVAEPRLIMLGLAQDYEKMRHAPPGPGNHHSNTEIRRQYNRGARASLKVANFIRSLGYQATPHHGPVAGALNMIPAALSAGFGELGKHGSIINRRLGSDFRLAGVSTDLPLIADRPDVFGADDFCTHCHVCTDACPPDAISETKRTVRGELKWYVDFDKCIPYFGERLGCALCMVVCPWSRPGIAENLLVKLARRNGKGD